MPRLTINRDVLAGYMRDEHITTQAELAARMGVAQSTVTRLLDGTSQPGPATIAGFRIAFPGRSTDSLITTP